MLKFTFEGREPEWKEKSQHWHQKRSIFISAPFTPCCARLTVCESARWKKFTPALILPYISWRAQKPLMSLLLSMLTFDFRTACPRFKQCCWVKVQLSLNNLVSRILKAGKKWQQGHGGGGVFITARAYLPVTSHLDRILMTLSQ